MGDLMPAVELRPVDAASWGAVARLEVTPEQRRFVAEPSYYLAMCAYGGVWNALAMHHDGEVVGFLMWALDDADGSCWLGGLLVDAAHQGRGVGRAAVTAAFRLLRPTAGPAGFALSYQPENVVAKGLYAALGFEETGEDADGEAVARLATT